MKVLRIAISALTVIAAVSVATNSIAASAMTAKPMAKPMAAKVVVPPSTLFCEIGKSGTEVVVQVINKGTKDVAAGTVFAYTVFSAKTKTAGSYKLVWALGPKETINLTKPMAAASATKCTPTAA